MVLVKKATIVGDGVFLIRSEETIRLIVGGNRFA